MGVLCRRIGEVLGYNPGELVGKSLYDFHHAMDSEVVEKGFKCCEYTARPNRLRFKGWDVDEAPVGGGLYLNLERIQMSLTVLTFKNLPREKQII